MTTPCQHPEESRRFIKDTGFDCDREWCEGCGALREWSSVHLTDIDKYEETWGPWELPKREQERI